jgi:cytochrome c oxidase assembly protein Cox11
MSDQPKFHLGQKVDVKNPMTNEWMKGEVTTVTIDVMTGLAIYNIQPESSNSRFHKVPEDCIETHCE